MNQHNWPRPVTKILVGLLLCLLFAACSTVRIGYSQGERLAYWWLDSYVDFDASQKAAVKPDIARLLQWHRQTQLSIYRQFLLQLQQQLQGGMNRDGFETMSRQAEQFSQTLMQHAVPELARLALSLNQSNLDHLRQKFESNNAEYRKKYLQSNPEAREKKRIKRVLEQAEDWFGRLEKDQELKIRRLILARPASNRFWLEERIERQQLILTVLEKIVRDKPSVAQAEELIRQALHESVARTAEPARKAFFDAWHEASMNLMLTVVNSTSTQQKAHAVKKVQGWIDDIDYLLARNRPGAAANP